MPGRRTYSHPIQPHKNPIRMFSALVAAGKYPVWFWKSPEKELMVAWGSRHTMTLPPMPHWRDAMPRLFADLADSVHAGRGERPPMFYRMAFDPAISPMANWNGLGGIAAHIPAGVYRKTRTSANLTIYAKEADRDAMLAQWMDAPPAVPRMRGANVAAVDWCDDEFAAIVSRGIGALLRGGASKVVLSRAIDVRAGNGFAPARIMKELAQSYPDCFLVAVAVPGRVFISATPERLARVEGGVAYTEALAGSLPRDARHEESALATDKNILEHKLVVRMIRRTLTPFCTELHEDGEPSPLALKNIVHLRTRFTGSLKPGFGIVDLVAQLHPTPAVCGQPRAAALGLIHRLEDFDRGLYAGVLGWCDAAGNGEAAVALRSALLEDRRATLFAGAGIMKDSVIADELRETHAKARAVLDAL